MKVLPYPEPNTTPGLPPPGPPAYLWAETCAICWEPCSLGMVDRFFHRRRWGHNSEILHPQPSKQEHHDAQVKAAAEWRRRNDPA